MTKTQPDLQVVYCKHASHNGYIQCNILTMTHVISQKFRKSNKPLVSNNVRNYHEFSGSICNMIFLGNGALDTSLKYTRSFPIVLILIHMYNVLKVTTFFFRCLKKVMSVNKH